MPIEASSRAAETLAAPVFLSEKEATALLGLPSRALRDSRTRGHLAGMPPPKWVKLGRTVRYRRKDLLKWAESVAAEHSAPVAAHA